MNVFRCDTEIVHLSNNIEYALNYAETYRRTIRIAKNFLRYYILHLLSQDIVDDKRFENCFCKLEENVDNCR